MALARIDTPLKLILEEEGRRQSWLADKVTDKLREADPERPRVDGPSVWRWVHGLHEPEDATKRAIADVLRRELSDFGWDTEVPA